MTADEIRRRYPRAAERIAAEARAEERERIREIEEVAQAGHEDLVETAKYERTDLTAEEVARAMVRRDRRIRRRASMERELTEPREEDRR